MDTPPTFLSKLNYCERDDHIVFEEIGHKYTIRGETGYTSVTTLISKMFEHFDANKIIDKMFQNPQKMADPANKYFGMSKQDIKNLWTENGKNASELGTKMHNNIELYYNNVDVVDDSVEYTYFKQFLKDFPNLKAFRTEWCVYDIDLKLCGSIDMVFEDPEDKGSLLIYDWKRVREISYESFGNKKCLVPGLQYIPDTNLEHYSLQLNLYRYMLQKNYGKKINNLYLVVMHPENSTYERIQVNIMENEIDIIMNWWSNKK